MRLRITFSGVTQLLDSEMVRSNMSTAPAPMPKSKLLPIGILLMVVGLLGRPSLVKAVVAMQPCALRTVLFLIATDGLILCFFAGLTCFLLGWFKNRRAKGLAKSDQSPSSNR
jgi:hypothetical protein